MGKSESHLIKSAHRVLEILAYFDRKHPTATVMELSRSLSYPQSSTSELLRCLARLGYLHYDRYQRSYGPTARVALLGAWVAPDLFRGGTVLTVLDRIANAIGETVVLSTAASYVVQHLHAIEGSTHQPVSVQVGATDALLHSPIGKLLLSSYKDVHIRSAVHRLNAEEQNPEKQVAGKTILSELAQVRKRGWISGANPCEDGTGIVAALLPVRCGNGRLALSVFAKSDVIAARTEEIVRVFQQEFALALPAQSRPYHEGSNGASSIPVHCRLPIASTAHPNVTAMPR